LQHKMFARNNKARHKENFFEIKKIIYLFTLNIEINGFLKSRFFVNAVNVAQSRADFFDCFNYFPSKQLYIFFQSSVIQEL
jgi:hypothetical protein